jgi:hypothetical protein
VPSDPQSRRNDGAPALNWRTDDVGSLMADAERIKQEAWEAATRDSEQAWQRLGLR